MDNKVALEEHFAIPGYDGRPHFLSLEVWRDVERRLLDFTKLRLGQMDETGIGHTIISLTSPGVQGDRDAKAAVAGARTSNDILADAIAAHPDRFGGFAAVALQDVDEAIAELHRAVLELKFHGVLINSFSDMPDGSTARLDEERFDPFWSALENLNVPLYLHPRLLPADERTAMVRWPEMAGPVPEFTTETSSSALRLITSGVFDRHPTAQVILGHLGETLPYNIWRIENRMRKATDRTTLERNLTSYLTDNFYITTSGHFCTPSLLAAVEVMGKDRVMFSIDYPFDEMPQGSAWFDHALIDEDLRQQIGRENATRIFSL
jgi:predicted TIM-barrel fold metal-dependent hydrolase